MTDNWCAVDVVFDLHTGGNSMAMFPCAHMHLLEDDAQRGAMLEAMLAFLTDTVCRGARARVTMGRFKHMSLSTIL
jgi:predicted deacylase